MTQCKCDNCEWSGDVADCMPISDLLDRIETGGIVPAGECPICGALAYLGDTPSMRAKALLAQLAAFTTPFDNMDERKRLFAREYFCDLSEVTDDDVISDYSGDDALEEAQALWRLVQEAREIIASQQGRAQ